LTNNSGFYNRYYLVIQLKTYSELKQLHPKYIGFAKAGFEIIILQCLTLVLPDMANEGTTMASLNRRTTHYKNRSE